MSQGQGVQPQAQAPPQGVAQAALEPPVLALGPGKGNTLLDYNNTSHIKMYYKMSLLWNISLVANLPTYVSSLKA